MRHLRIAILLVALVCLGWAAGASAAPNAYITNSNFGFGGSVSVLDTATNMVVATVSAGSFPVGVAVTQDGTRVFVTDQSSNALLVIDTATNSVIATVTVGLGRTPRGVAVNSAGTRVYVANLGSNSVSVLETVTNTVIATVLVGTRPLGVAVNPAGTRVYVANSGNNIVSVIDADTNVVIAAVSVGLSPQGLVVTPDGKRVYVTNQGSQGLRPVPGSVSVLETVTNTVIATVPVGTIALGVAVNPAGTRVYVTNQGSNSVWVLDVASNTVVAVVPVGAGPYGVSVKPDGSAVYVVNNFGDNVSVIDAATNTVTATIAVGSFPIAFGSFIASPTASANATTVSLDAVAPNTVVVHSTQPVVFTAQLVRKDTGAALAGATINFLVDGVATGSVTTGKDGVATVTFDPSSLTPGFRMVTAQFAGATIGGVTWQASTSAPQTLQVVYLFDGFEGPLENVGLTERKAGSTVPIKWELEDANGEPMGSLSSVQSVLIGLFPCTGGAPSTIANLTAAVQLESDEGKFIVHWQTPKSGAGQCYRVTVTLDDGTTHAADIRLR